MIHCATGTRPVEAGHLWAVAQWELTVTYLYGSGEGFLNVKYLQVKSGSTHRLTCGVPYFEGTGYTCLKKILRIKSYLDLISKVDFKEIPSNLNCIKVNFRIYCIETIY
jgi:hypothetical protein